MQLDLLRIGYLWLLRAAQMPPGTARPWRPWPRRGRLRHPGAPGTRPATARPQVADIFRGVLGHRCGILNPNRLAGFYAQEVARLGGQFHFDVEVTGFVLDHQGLIRGVKVGDQRILARQVLVATGPWLAATLALAGLNVPVVPVKRQLFAIPAQAGAAADACSMPGALMPTASCPLPSCRERPICRPAPAAHAFIVGFANEDQPPGSKTGPRPRPEFFEARIRPQLEQYFPASGRPGPASPGPDYYEDHPPDHIAFVDRIAGALVVGGASGSGIMKADSLGRAAAGLFYGKAEVELGDGNSLKVADLGLEGRTLPPEEFVI